MNDPKFLFPVTIEFDHSNANQNHKYLSTCMFMYKIEDVEETQKG